MADISEITRLLDRATWDVAIVEARRGAPQLLARLLVKEPIPDELKKDVELVVANPVRARNPGGRPSKRPSDFVIRELKRWYDMMTKGSPADEDGDALVGISQSQALSAIAERYDVDEKTVRNWLGIVESPKAKRKNTRA